MHTSALLLPLLIACGDKSADSASADDSGHRDEADTDTGTGTDTSADPFADRVEQFSPGAGAGFGQDGFPDIVLGPPEGEGKVSSLDVLSLGQDGEIILELDDIMLVDGDGPDLLVFENPFPGWYETGIVAVSDDGKTWHEWPCDAEDADSGYPGCAGVALVWSSSTNGISATDPDVAGGDAFDLADLGVKQARFVRIRDSGANDYSGTSGGFDLDAVAVVNGAPVDGASR